MLPSAADTGGRPAIVGKAIDKLPQPWDGFAKLVRDGLGITALDGRRAGLIDASDAQEIVGTILDLGV